MSKSTGQIVGGVLGAIGGFFVGGPAGAVKGALIGSSIGGMIDPPPGPDLKGPTLEDKSFNSAAYGVSLATLHGTIAHTGSIIYLENNEYKAVAKKQKTGGKGGSPKGSYTTTTYFATFAVAIGEAMPGSVIRRIWAGGKLIYSVGESVDIDSIRQSNSNAAGWHYYNGTQTDPDSRMEAVLGVGNCPSYEGTAYIMFYDFDLTEYGNGLQGCPIKVEVIADFEAVNDLLPFQKVFEAIMPFDESIYDTYWGEWRENHAFVRALSPSSALFIAQWTPHLGGGATASYHRFNAYTGDWETGMSAVYNTDIAIYPGLTFGDYLNWQQYDLSSGTLPNNYQDGSPTGWAFKDTVKMVHGGRLHSGSFDWDDEPSYGATYGDGYFYIINNSNIIKLNSGGMVYASRATNTPLGSTYYRLWYDDGFLYRADPVSGGALRVFVYDGNSLATVRSFTFGNFPFSTGDFALQFAVYGGLFVVGWSTRFGAEGGELHYEQWRFKDFNAVQPASLDTVVGRHMSAAGIPGALRDLTALESDYVDGYRITDVSSARGKLGPLQAAFLFDYVEYGYTVKAVKRGGSPIVTIPLTDLGARAAGDSPGVLVTRERETDSQLPSYYSVTYLDYSREYDTNTQDANYPSRTSNQKNQSLPVVLSADRAAQLADIYINLAWMERDTYSFSLPQKYIYLKPANVIQVEIAAGLYAVMRISSISYGANQRLEVSAKRAEPAVYQSSAVGIAVTPPSENIPVIVPANTIILDLPALNDATTGYGFGVAMCGGPSWKGGAFLRSLDAGQTYDAIQGFGANCTFARAVNYLPAGDYFVMDRATELNINVIAGEFFSITEAQMLTGKHYCAYGADGRWEIIQYATATVISGATIKLTTFVRGLFGTEWAGDLHEAGDMLVLLDDPDTAFVGADAVALNSPRKFKGVTTGQDAQDATELNFTYRGTNLKPLSPVNVSGELVAEVWTITCTKRTRMASNQWATGIAAPIGEVALLFEFEIYDGSVFKKMYQSVTETFVYSAVNQMADFGYLPTTLTVKIYQISAVIGRGFGVEKTLIGLGDIYGDKVALLLHGEGANNSTVFIDSSKIPKTITVYGNAKISTDQFRSGSSSGCLDGVGDYLSIAHHADLNLSSRKFCIEGYVWCNALTADSQTICDKDGVYGSTYPSYSLSITSAGKIRGALGNGTSGVTIQTYTGATTLPLSQWVHLAFTFDGTTARVFVGGALDASSTTIPARVDGGKPLLIGYAAGNPSACYLNGYFDDIRITYDEPRYTSDFTPPSQQLPDPI